MKSGNKEIKMLLINVSIRPGAKVIYIPIGLAYIATALKNRGYIYDLLDLDANNYSEEYISEYLRVNQYDIVCMGCIVTGYKHIKRMAQMIRKAYSQTRIIVGNSVASSMPGILLNKTEVDIAVNGEGDITIVELLDAICESRELKSVRGIFYKENGKINATQARDVIKDLDSVGFPDWSLFDMPKYIKSCSNGGVAEPLPMGRDEIRAFTLSTARGCPFQCTFCYHVFRGTRYRYISTEKLISEIKKLKSKYDLNYFLFTDDLTFVNKKHAKEFAENLLHEKVEIYWSATCRSDLFNSEADVELVKLFKRAGCVGVSFSLENADPEILKMINKKSGTENFSNQCKILRKAGIACWTSLVFGFPIETKETINKTIDCCIANGIYPSTGYLTPMPGTPVYEDAIKSGFIKNEEEYLLSLGDRQDFLLNMTKMTDDQFVKTIHGALARCNDALGIKLNKMSLLKTGYYRVPKVNN